MKHKILCTIKSALYYAGFKGSFLNGKILADSLVPWSSFLFVLFLVSDPRHGLAVIVSGLHLEDVRDDAVDLHVADEPGEEQLLGNSCTYQPEGGKTQQQLG